MPWRLEQQIRPGVNFTNILRAAFRLTDPKSVKYTVSCQFFFALLKAAR